MLGPSVGGKEVEVEYIDIPEEESRDMKILQAVLRGDFCVDGKRIGIGILESFIIKYRHLSHACDLAQKHIDGLRLMNDLHREELRRRVMSLTQTSDV